MVWAASRRFCVFCWSDTPQPHHGAGGMLAGSLVRRAPGQLGPHKDVRWQKGRAGCDLPAFLPTPQKPQAKKQKSPEPAHVQF